MRIDPAKPRYRALWISDVHLGMHASRAGCLADFLERHQTDRLYLLGDIVDGHRLRRKWNWSPACDRVTHAVLDFARAGTRIVYIPGNHDAFLRAYAGETVCGIQVELECDHVTADGRLLHMQHGDAFDGYLHMASLGARIGRGVYHVTTFLSHLVRRVARLAGLPDWSLSQFLKNHSRQASRYVSAYEDAMVEEAKRRKVAGIICGHIHQPAHIQREGVRYINTGDWVEHCTLLAEHPDGTLELIHWDERRSAEHGVDPHRVTLAKPAQKTAEAQAQQRI